MNISAFILARGGSKGIPKKNIIDFCGKPLIEWTIQQCKDSTHIKDIYVSTDDTDIYNISKDLGAIPVDRPSKLSKDSSSSEDALSHLYCTLLKKDIKLDYIVHPQITSPIRTSKDLDIAVETIINTDSDSLFSASKLDDVCVWDSNGNSITYDYKDRKRRQDKKPYYLENGSIYIFKPDIVMNHSNRLGGNIVKYIMPFWKSYEIDTIEDVELCEYYMRRMNNENKK